MPSRFLLEGNHSVQGCSTVFNGLIALEKAATGNAVWGGGGITWRRYWQQEKVRELA